MLITAQHAGTTKLRTVDLSGVQLTIPAASILSDVFTIEWGLRKLVFKECDLDEHVRRLSHSSRLSNVPSDPETNAARSPHPKLPHLPICGVQSSSLGGSIPVNWRIFRKGPSSLEAVAFAEHLRSLNLSNSSIYPKIHWTRKLLNVS